MSTSAKQQLVVGGLTFLITYIVYVFTAARYPIFGDGLEFVAAAAVNGVPHPTGYPLMMLLLGPFAQGSNAYFFSSLLCGLFSAGTASLAALLAFRMLHWQALGIFDQYRPHFAICIGLTIGFTGSVWGAATAVEAYGLNALLLISILFALVSREKLPIWRLALAGGLQGLALCNHLTSGAMLPFLLFKVWQNRSLGPALFASVPIAFCIGLLPYLSIPLRASGNPPINWGDPKGFSGILWLIGGGDYKAAQFLQASPGRPFTAELYAAFFISRAINVLALPGTEMAPLLKVAFLRILLGVPVFLALAGGLRMIWKMNRLVLIAMLVPALLQLGFIMTYNIPDIADYWLGFWIVLLPVFCAGLAFSLQKLSSILEKQKLPEKAPRVAFACLVLPALFLFGNYLGASQQNEEIALVWIENAATSIPEESIILGHGDYDTYSLWYLQHVMNGRDDLLVVGGNFLRSAWYESMLPEEDPFGRNVTTSPGEFTNFTVYDHVAMLRENVIEPNIGSVPIITTHAPPELLSVLAQHYRVTPIARLLEDAQLEYMLSRYPATAPPLLYRIEKFN